MSELDPFLSELRSQESPGGGWGYLPGRPAHPEPTALALLALSLAGDRHADVLGRGRDFLRSNRQPDGSYRLTRGRPQATWGTALALFAECSLGGTDTNSTADFLLRLRGNVVAADPELSAINDIDPSAVGWPWAENNFAWVEPTAWALLALRKAGRADHPRIAEGMRLLLDRTRDEGGLNYGSRTVLGTPTAVLPGPTALGLLALQGTPAPHPRLLASADWLAGQAATSDDLDHLCWSRIALTRYAGRPTVDTVLPLLADRIRAGHAAHAARHGGPPNPARHALTALALAAGSPTDPFALGSGPAPASVGDPTVAAGSSPMPTPPPPLGFLGGLQRRFRGLMVTGMNALRPLPPTPAVHIAHVPTYDGPALAEALRRQFDHFRSHAPLAGKHVVVKPNFVEYHPGRPVNTDVRFLRAVLELCRAEGAASVTVAEGPGHWRNTAYTVAASGLGTMLRELDIPFVDLNTDEPVRTLNLGRLTGLEYLFLTETVTRADVLISVPKMKTHHWAGMTASLKNLFGTLPGHCYGWPKNELHWRGIPNSIVDIALTTLAPPMTHLAVVDGIVGMEGDGPLAGRPVESGAVVMGVDFPAVDATCARLMGLDPHRVPHLILAAERRLGRIAEAAIPQLGEPITRLARAFELPPQIEKHLLAKPA